MFLQLGHATRHGLGAPLEEGLDGIEGRRRHPERVRAQTLGDAVLDDGQALDGSGVVRVAGQNEFVKVARVVIGRHAKRAEESKTRDSCLPAGRLRRPADTSG